MSAIEVTVKKTTVYHEVMKEASYIGMKGDDGSNGSYERVSLTDANRELLERWWVEACDEATKSLRRWLVGVGESSYSHGVDLTGDYVARILPGLSFNSALESGLSSSLTAWFVHTLLSRWLGITQPERVAFSVSQAAMHMDDVLRRLYHKKRPDREDI